MLLDYTSYRKSPRLELHMSGSFRVSKFRIIYRLVSDVVEIIALGPRRSIYEETLRLLKRADTK